MTRQGQPVPLHKGSLTPDRNGSSESSSRTARSGMSWWEHSDYEREVASRPKHKKPRGRTKSPREVQLKVAGAVKQKLRGMATNP